MHERRCHDEALPSSRDLYRLAIDSTHNWEYWIGPCGRFIYVSPSCERITGYKPEDFYSDAGLLKAIAHPEDRQLLTNHLKTASKRNRALAVEFRIRTRKCDTRWIGHNCRRICDFDGTYLGRRASNQDITAQKRFEAAIKANRDDFQCLSAQRANELLAANQRLESVVKECRVFHEKLRKSEERLRDREKELLDLTQELQEVNSALKILLKKREEDKTELEEKILFSLGELIEPYIEKLKAGRLTDKQETYVKIIESNLKDIVSPFSRRLSHQLFHLTPTELLVANLVKQGKTSKEIADLLDLSTRTIDFHRDNIRKKLGLKNTKRNLRSLLLSINADGSYPS